MSDFQKSMVSAIVTVATMILGLFGLHVSSVVILPWAMFAITVGLLVQRQWKDCHQFFTQQTAVWTIISGAAQAAIDFLHFSLGWLTPELTTAIAVIIAAIGTLIVAKMAHRNMPAPGFTRTYQMAVKHSAKMGLPSPTGPIY